LVSVPRWTCDRDIRLWRRLGTT